MSASATSSDGSRSSRSASLTRMLSWTWRRNCSSSESVGIDVRRVVAAVAEAFEVGVDHHLDHLLKADLGLPTQVGLGAGRIAQEPVDLGGTEEGRIDDDVVVVVESDTL